MQQKKLRFVAPTSAGVTIETYEIDDPALIREMLAACVSLYAENQAKIEVILVMYRQSHQQMMGFAKWWTKPFTHLQLKGG